MVTVINEFFRCKYYYNDIAGHCVRYSVSCHGNCDDLFQGIEDLKTALFKSTLQQEYMGEQIPEAWLQLENILYK